MEQGTLPAAGVSHRVLDALAAIVGTSSEALRRAGESIGPRAGPAGEETVFARTAQQRLDLEPPEAPSAPADASPPEMAAEWDEVDRLFMGGE